jgi:hypothetical protein
VSIRTFPIPQAEPESELIPLEEVGERFGVHIDTVRKWIKADMADGRNRVPGSRGEGSRYIVVRAIFERALRDGVEPPRSPKIVAPDLTHIVDHLRRRATEDLALADNIAGLMASTKERIA